jgi:dynein heavy chain, axonemal
VTVVKYLQNLSSEKWSTIFVNFSAQTSENMTQDIIDAQLIKRRKGVFGPSLGKQAIIFVDDLNMPVKEVYGAQPPIEILRQSMSQGGWYDRETQEFKSLVSIQYIAAMGPPGGGRTQITSRMMRHFSTLMFTPFEASALKGVFSSILRHFFRRYDNNQIKSWIDPVVNAAVEIYDSISESLRPTPKKLHYTYNLRDISKVMQGMCQVSSSNLKTKATLVKLFGHECTRVFHDRLINEEDRDWFKGCLEKTVKKYLKENWSQVISNEDKNHVLLFGSFVDQADSDHAEYKEMSCMKELKETAVNFLQDYNAMNKKKMDLVLFMNAIEHCSRISRVLNLPRGNALLVGVGGSGRRSLTRLAASMSEYKVFEIEITKTYGKNEWKEDLIKVFRNAGEANKPTVFLLSDTQIKEEIFVEHVNNILNVGEVPNLFDMEVRNEILENVTKDAAEAGVNQDLQANVWNFFVERAKRNLHIVLAFSPVGDTFRKRLLMFPSLVNCCTIDWFTEWPEEALISVARSFLKSGLEDLSPETMDGVISCCVAFQTKVSKLSKTYAAVDGRYFYVTPTSYLELLSSFGRLEKMKREQVEANKRRYDVGLTKIRETSKLVKGMEEELVALQPTLAKLQKETNEMIAVIEKKTIEVS